MKFTDKMIGTYLESLVGKRYTLSEINAQLTKLFKTRILANVGGLDTECADYNLMFCYDNQSTKDYVDCDIYFLPTRKHRNYECVLYITEIGFERS